MAVPGNPNIDVTETLRQLRLLEQCILGNNFRDGVPLIGGMSTLTGTLGALLAAWANAESATSPRLSAGYGSYK